MNINKIIATHFLKWAKKNPDRLVLGQIENGVENYISKKLFSSKICALILFIKDELRLSKATKISLISKSSLNWHLVDMATMLSQNITVPIYPTYLPEEIEYIVNHSDSEIIFVEDCEQLNKILKIQNKISKVKNIVVMKTLDDTMKHEASSKCKIQIWTLEEILSKQIKNSEPSSSLSRLTDILSQCQEADVASIIYTSGTTGTPKGAVITQKAFYTLINNISASLSGPFGESDKSLVFLPLSHVLGRCDSFLYMIFDHHTVYSESIEKLVNEISIARPTLLISVPRIFEKLYNHILKQIENSTKAKRKLFNWALDASNLYFQKIESNLTPTFFDTLQKNIAYKLVFSKIFNRFGGRVKYFVSGGAPIAPEIIRFLRNANLLILEGYGLTETIAPCIVNPLYKQVVGSVGIPIGDVSIDFAEDNEILIKSEAMFKEYYKDPISTEESLKGGWLHTGDVGILTNNGHLVITDRKKDLIITSGGKNIAPQKIENMAKTTKHIAQMMIIGDKRNYLTAIIGIEKTSILETIEKLNLPKDISHQALAQNSMIREIISTELNEINKRLARFETIKNFIIAGQEISVENGFLTPSMKIRRKKLLAHYQKEVDDMYGLDTF